METTKNKTAVGPPDYNKPEIVELFQYQKEGAAWLAKKKCALLAFDMGLGKTATTIAACDAIGAKRVLVICPGIARINWTREFKKFSDRPWEFDVILSRTTPRRPGASVVTSYHLATDLHEALAKEEFDVLILDEMHMVTSVDAKRSHAVFGSKGLVHQVKRVWALSGTPAPNHAGELWILLRTFGVTKLSYDAFIELYCDSYRVSFTRRQISGTRKDMIPALREMLAPIMLRRMKKDVLKDLPPITYSDIVVEPGPVDLEIDAPSSLFRHVFPEDKSKELFDQIRAEEKLIESILNQPATGADRIKALEAMAKSVSTLRMYAGLQKVVPVADMVKEELLLGLYKKIVIFAIHRDVIEGLRVRLSKFKAVTLYGGTNPRTAQRNVDDFQKKDNYQVFIGNIDAAGPAITLTAATHVLFVEQAWSPGKNNQAAMRVHRYGQTEPVTVRFVGLANSIDERVTQILKRKTRELAEIFDKRAKDFYEQKNPLAKLL